MLYWLAKFTMWFALKVYFKKITVFGSKHIPDEKPVILIVNHSASFLDAIILGCLLKRELYYYARSDVFKAGLAFKMMKAVHMIPIYNLEHSKEDLHRNTETFEEGEKVLARKKNARDFSGRDQPAGTNIIAAEKRYWSCGHTCGVNTRV